MGGFKAVDWREGKLFILDQTLLPESEVYREIKTKADICEAISSLRVRGAPAIGVAAAFGVVVVAREVFEKEGNFLDRIEEAVKSLVSTRPTAVNLKKAVERMMKVLLSASADREELLLKLEEEAKKIYQENLESDLKIAENGTSLLNSGDRVLTHCNTGALATAGYGTALGVIKKACEQGKKIKVFVDETRPLLQGSRLTAWELEKLGIDYEIIVDSAAGFLMAQGKIDKIIVGADRIALNGDTANKIGTHSLGVLAKHYRLPFYVAAPLTTFDFELKQGEGIPIEERQAKEVLELKGVRLAPSAARAYNLAFDVTPSHLISAFITEKGLIFPPFTESIGNLRERI